MGWSIIGRGALCGLLALAGCATTGGRPSAGDTEELRATIRGVYEAVERGDEAAYRRLVVFPPGDAYSDALTATMFESVRLHQAVEARLHVRDDPSDGPTTATAPTSHASSRPASRRLATTHPRAHIAAVDYRENARAMIKAVSGWTFTVRGNRATIDQIAAQPGAPALLRENGRWILAPRPWDTRRDTATYRLGVEQERASAKALSMARQAIEDGSATSIDDANEIIRNLLTEPTTTTTTQP